MRSFVAVFFWVIDDSCISSFVSPFPHIIALLSSHGNFPTLPLNRNHLSIITQFLAIFSTVSAISASHSYCNQRRFFQHTFNTFVRGKLLGPTQGEPNFDSPCVDIQVRQQSYIKIQIHLITIGIGSRYSGTCLLWSKYFSLSRRVICLTPLYHGRSSPVYPMVRKNSDINMALAEIIVHYYWEGFIWPSRAVNFLFLTDVDLWTGHLKICKCSTSEEFLFWQEELLIKFCLTNALATVKICLQKFTCIIYLFVNTRRFRNNWEIYY